MALFHGYVTSQSMNMNTGLSVILPQKTDRCDAKGRFPVLYLLHGLGDNSQAWSSYSNITRYAERAGIAVVMPEVQRSFYMDMTYGLRYFTYVSEELPKLSRQMFNVTDDPAHTYVAGLSMGGYGALKLALRNPDRFAAVGSFSGAVDVRSHLASDAFRNPETVGRIGDKLKPEDDLFMLIADAAKQHKKLPSMYITCGLSDFLYEDHQRIRQHLDFLKVPYVYEEWAGAHEWDVWDRSVRQFLQFIGYSVT